MSDGAAFLVDHVFGDTPIRHWVLSLPPPLRFVVAYDSKLLTEILSSIINAVFQHLRWKAKQILRLDSVSMGRPGAITAIQRCSSSLALDVHFHSMVTDGIFLRNQPGSVTFLKLPPPTDEEVTAVAWETCRRSRLVLIRRGLWRDVDGGADDLESTPPPGLADHYTASIRGVLSLGPRRGQRVVRFFGQAARAQEDDRAIRRTGYGFDLWARQGIPAGEHARLEKLARYVLRPPLAEGRLSRLPSSGVVLRLKRPWRDGTTGMVFEPLDFLGKLAALVPWPRTNTIRFHGVYAAAARERAKAHRAAVLPTLLIPLD